MSRYFNVKNKVAGDVIEAEAVIMDLGTGRYFSAGNSGAYIWSCIEAGFNQTQISDALVSAYQIDAEEAERAVTHFAEQLIANRLVVPVDALEASSASLGTLPASPDESFKFPELMVYDDMQDLLLLDPIHESDDDAGWPKAMPPTDPTTT